MRTMKKDMKKASKKHVDIERTVFNDEELRRYETMVCISVCMEKRE